MKWSYDNTCRLQRKAAFQVHCMKRRRINATDRDHYTIEQLHILIIWLQPTLEISIVNWLILLESGNAQCTEGLRELTGLTTLKKTNPTPKNNCYGNPVYHTQCISPSDIVTTHRNTLEFLLLKSQHQAGTWTQILSAFFPLLCHAFITVPHRDTCGYNPDQSWLRFNSWKAQGSILDLWKPNETEGGGLNPGSFHPHPSRSRRLESHSPLSHLQPMKTDDKALTKFKRWYKWQKRRTITELFVTLAINEKKILNHYK